jgi:predicted RNase H-like HicB family nuclease
MTRYTALIDGEAGAYGVHFPDLPGCVAMGASIEDAMFNAAEALREFAADVTIRASALPAPRAAEELTREPDVRNALQAGASLASVPLVRETGQSVKANLSINAGILAAIDEEAARRGLTRSALVEMMARHALASVG